MFNTQFKAIAVRFDYLHAERLQHTPQGVPQFVFNVQLVIGPNAFVKDDFVEIPFSLVASTNPSFVSVSIRGALILQGDPRQIKEIADMVNSGKIPPNIQSVITQYVLFEVNLLLKELGIPPALAPTPPIPQQPQREGGVMHV